MLHSGKLATHKRNNLFGQFIDKKVLLKFTLKADLKNFFGTILSHMFLGQILI